MHDILVLLAKIKLNKFEVLISQAPIDSYISHNESVIINDVLEE